MSSPKCTREESGTIIFRFCYPRLVKDSKAGDEQESTAYLRLMKQRSDRTLDNMEQ